MLWVLKVHYTVMDDSGSASVVFWDNLTVQLVEKTAAELNVIVDNNKNLYGIPKELENLIGKKMMLKMKLNDYNARHSSSSISVSSYTICEDLIEQFMQASNEDELIGSINAKKDGNSVFDFPNQEGNGDGEKVENLNPPST
ncbi:uncharacterized protein LOC114716446 [Neltuma alba]|uniref:uncharacterized protein LOC114716446 n=1 Tax=Neltuma alba TaxID=207710 RepID=UPI0010A54D1C|nr:uncharacterized protein LOC114716446 [Prosopis alba]